MPAKQAQIHPERQPTNKIIIEHRQNHRRNRHTPRNTLLTQKIDHAGERQIRMFGCGRNQWVPMVMDASAGITAT
jgi:hypothetical protein